MSAAAKKFGVVEAAGLLGINPYTVRAHCLHGRMGTKDENGRYVITQAEIDAHKAKQAARLEKKESKASPPAAEKATKKKAKKPARRRRTIAVVEE